MRFMYEGVWFVETAHGWAPLPDGKRPSDIVSNRPEAFTAPPRPVVALSQHARCDTDHEREFADITRLAVALARHLGRPVAPTLRQLRGPGGPRPMVMMRRILCAIADGWGTKRATLTLYLGRHKHSVAEYTRQGQAALAADPALQRLRDRALAAASQGSALCSPSWTACRGIGRHSLQDIGVAL